MQQPCVYILLLENSQYYIGSTTNFSRRYKEHLKCDHSGTKYSKPISIKLIQYFDTNNIARKIELRLKKLKSRKVIEKIINDKKIDICLLGA